jgi:ankyrin repeat protein
MNLLPRVLIAGFHVPSHAAAKFLLARGPDIDVRNPLTDETPLLFMAGRTRSPRGTRLREAAAEFLLEQGANMFFMSNRGQKPWVKAAMKGNAGICRIFLEWLDKNSISLDDTKPLIMEAMKTEHREFAKVLSRWYWRRIYPCPS